MTMAPDKLLDSVAETMARYDMVTPGDRVLAALSGGADSVCLVHTLAALNIPFEIAHFDHQTRDGASAEDAAFVEALAKTLGAPYHQESRPVADEAAQSNLSFEAYAREARYAFLLRTARVRSCPVIATGHHRDDVAETMLLRLLRGTSPQGLGGIPPVRSVQTGKHTVRIIRPLIDCSRADIEAWLHERAIAFRTDESNSDTTFLRNRIRHELLPQLIADYNPRLPEALARLAALLRDEDAYLDGQTRAFLAQCRTAEGHLNRAAFRAGPRALQRRALLLFAWERGCSPDYARIEAVMDFVANGPSGNRCDVGGGLMLRNARETTEPEVLETPHEDSCALATPGITHALGHVAHVRYLDALPAVPLHQYCTPTRQVLDADRVQGTLTLRRRRPGDRFIPLGMTGHRKLKDYFIDLGLSHSARQRQLLLTDSMRILWVVGNAVSADAAITADTRRWLEIEVLDGPDHDVPNFP